MKKQNDRGYSTENIIDALEEYVTERRKQRIDAVIAGRLNSIQLAIEAPSDINNALAAVRTCEALGIAKIHLIQPEGDAGAVRRITQGAFYWVDIAYYHSLEAFLTHARAQKLVLAGGTVTATKPLHTVPVEQPLCIMIGNEQRGLSDAAVKSLDHNYTIPMYGMSESMNLSVSAAISLYDTTQRKRAALQTNADLTHTEQMETRAKYYLNSVNRRLIDALLP